MYRKVFGWITTGVLALAICLPLARPDDGGEATTNKSAQKHNANALKWKQHVLQVPVGSYVKIKLENHKEFEGQLRDISDSNFSVQCLMGKQIESVSIDYGDIKSLSVAGKHGTGEKVAKTLLTFGP